MRSKLNSIDLNRDQNARSSVNKYKSKLPLVQTPSKSSKFQDDLQKSFLTQSSPIMKQKGLQSCSPLPQIKGKQKEISNDQQGIKKLLKEKSLALKLAPVKNATKSKFGWIAQQQPGMKLSGSFGKQNFPKIRKQSDFNKTFLEEASLIDEDKKIKQESLKPSMKSISLKGKNSIEENELSGNISLKLNKQNSEKSENVSVSLYEDEFRQSNKPSERNSSPTDDFLPQEKSYQFIQGQQNNQFAPQSQSKQSNNCSMASSEKQIDSQENKQCQSRVEIGIEEQQQEEPSEALGVSCSGSDQNEKTNLLKDSVKGVRLTCVHDKIAQIFTKLSPRALEHLNLANNAMVQASNAESNTLNGLLSHKDSIQSEPQKSQSNQHNLLSATSPGLTNKNLPSMRSQFNRTATVSFIQQSTFDDLSKSPWLQTMQELKKQLQKMDDSNIIMERSVWLYIISTFDRLYMDKEERFTFLQILSDLLNVNFRKKEIQDQLNFCGQIGQKFSKLQNTIHFKHKECLKYFRFIMEKDTSDKPYPVLFPNLKFDMNQEQIKQMSKVVYKLCANNMDAFAYITLYFQIALDRLLKEQSFSYVEDLFLCRIKYLQKLYPANKADLNKSSSKKPQNQKNVEEQHGKQHKKVLQAIVEAKQFKDTILQSYGIQDIKTEYKFEYFYFNEESTQSHLTQLIGYVKKQAESARKDETVFTDLVKKSCVQNGYGFKSDVKIKDNASQNFSILRTIQKMLSSSFEKDLILMKQLRMKNADQNQNLKYSENGVNEFIYWEQQQVQQDLKGILQRQDKIQFKAKDLVRGKCKFNSIQQIRSTITLLKKKIQQNESKGIYIVDLENRLSKNTKDVVMLIKLPHSIAELQLALKQDTILNQFNHKIYELKRSKIYACVTNLFIHSKKWGTTFFRQQIQLFRQMIAINSKQKFGQKVSFEDLRDSVINFERNYLRPNGIRCLKDQLKSFDENRQIQRKVDTIQRIMKSPYSYKIDKRFRKDMRKQNQIMFYLKNTNLQKAWDIIKQFSEEQLDENPIILRLKGDILRQRQDQGDEKKCIQCYERYVNLQRQENGQSIQLANVLLMLGQIRLNNRKFQKALTYFKRCATIKQKRCGKDSIDVAMVLNRIGHLYRIKSQYSIALQFYNKSLDIAVKKTGKDSLYAAEIYSGLGNAYYGKGEVHLSLEYYQKSLEIYKKIKGKSSMQVSIIYNNIGNFYKQQLKFEEAIKCYYACLEIKQKLKGPQSLDVAHVYNNIGILYRKMQNFTEAQKFYRLCMYIRQKIKGSESYHAAESYINIGKFYTAKFMSKSKSDDDYVKAMDYLKKALRIKLAILKLDSTEVADVLFSIGSLYWTVKNQQKALQYYNESLKILDKLLGKDSIDSSKVYINIGIVYQDKAKQDKEKGRIDDAKKRQQLALYYYEKGLAIQQKIRPTQSIDLAQTYYNLSQLYTQMQVYNRAYEYANRAYEIWKKQKSADYKYTQYAFIQRERIMQAINKQKIKQNKH